MKKNSVPTMKDVAKEAGVALGTVSKVINGIYVRDSYKQKVEDAIVKLNYQVNTYARGLKTSKTETITLIIPNLLSPFFSLLAYEIEQQAYAHGRKLILCCSNGLPEKEMDYISLATQSKTDGIIALTYSDISKLVPEHIPLIAFDRQFENRSIARIASDNYQGGMLAVEKLIELGCKQPIFIRFHSSFRGEADRRFEGYLDACKKHKIKPIYFNQVDADNQFELIEEFLKDLEDSTHHKLKFDGIFANTDIHACHAIKVLKDMGYQVPHDVQVIGFDGIKEVYLKSKYEYMVSTIVQPLPLIAQKCVELIVNIDNAPLPTLTLLPVHYAKGGTTKDCLF